MNSCMFCNKEIESGNLRCKDCDIIWQNGSDFGFKKCSFELKCILDKLKELSEGRI